MAREPISPPPVRRWAANYLPAYLSNGLLGIRAGSIPLVPAGDNPVIDGLLHFEPPGGLTTCGAAYHTEVEGREADYRGQVMWDIEAFAHPPLLLTQPDAARALLRYRTRHLDGAELNAALNGYAGLQFPWASSPLEGEEAIPTDAPLVTVEEHVNQAIANAFARQAQVTGDSDFFAGVRLAGPAGLDREPRRVHLTRLTRASTRSGRPRAARPRSTTTPT